MLVILPLVLLHLGIKHPLDDDEHHWISEDTHYAETSSSLKIRLSWRGGFVTESRTVVHRRNYTQNEWIGLLYTVHTPSHSQSILRPPPPLSLVSAVATDKKTRPDDMDVLWILKSKTMERMND